MEVRDLVRSGTTTIILPTGGTEQNGPHMALGKHNVRVKALGAAIARTLGGTLVAPVLAYVPEGGLAPPTGHMRYAGTITVPEPVFEGVLESAARSFAIHGFRDVVFIGDSGGNQAGQGAVARRLNRGWAATPVRAHAIDAYYRASTAGARALLQSRGYQDREIGNHAGALDTSLMLAVDPSVVRQERTSRGAGRRRLGGRGRRPEPGERGAGPAHRADDRGRDGGRHPAIARAARDDAGRVASMTPIRARKGAASGTSRARARWWRVGGLLGLGLLIALGSAGLLWRTSALRASAQTPGTAPAPAPGPRRHLGQRSRECPRSPIPRISTARPRRAGSAPRWPARSPASTCPTSRRTPSR